MPERPYRIARILYAPNEIRVCPVETLKKIAALAPVEPKPERYDFRRNYSGFNLEDFISKYIPSYDGPFPWHEGGRNWIPHECVNFPEHAKASYIIQFGNGAVAAGCLGNRCKVAGLDWHALREKFELGCYDR